MTKEKRKEIRKAYKEAGITKKTATVINGVQVDVLDLLNALDKAEARIKALESAIKNNSICDLCIHLEMDCRGFCSIGYEAWQYDQARLEKEENNGEDNDRDK